MVFQTFEITLKGFNGGTDKTDNLIKWVNSNDIRAVEKWVENNCYLPALDIQVIRNGFNEPIYNIKDGVDGETIWYLNLYFCKNCKLEWKDEWNCTCNDKCPICHSEIEPYNSIEL